MPESVGIRELRARASSIFRRVREKNESIDVTYRGELIARIVPVVRQAEADESLNAVWSDLDRLGAEIGKLWVADSKSAAEVVGEQRR